jgi:hypothetical protein
MFGQGKYYLIIVVYGQVVIVVVLLRQQEPWDEGSRSKLVLDEKEEDLDQVEGCPRDTEYQ